MKNLEQHVYKLLKETALIIAIKKTLPIGKHNETPDEKFNKFELEKGIEIEHEHTDNPEFAKAIAKDHLSEIPDYYTRLVRMEKEAGVKD